MFRGSKSDKIRFGAKKEYEVCWHGEAGYVKNYKTGEYFDWGLNSIKDGKKITQVSKEEFEQKQTEARKAKGGRLAIPSYQNINQVKKRSDSNSPSSYLAGDAFKIKTKSGHEVIAKRSGKELKILYFLRKNAQIDKRFDMIEQTTKTVQNRFSGQLIANLDQIRNGKV